MIRHILFDLDNTLYSARYGLEDVFFIRLQEYTSAFLGLSMEECEILRKEGYKRHGTTLAWLIAEKGFTDMDGYFAHVHPEDEADHLPPDPDLRRYIESLPCPCSILTNSPLFHAERIIKKLGFEGLFQHVFDVTYNKGKGKPNASSYLNPLSVLGLTPKEAIFIDDLPLYVEGYIAVGGRGILFDDCDTYKDYTGERIRDLRELSNLFK